MFVLFARMFRPECSYVNVTLQSRHKQPFTDSNARCQNLVKTGLILHHFPTIPAAKEETDGDDVVI